MKSLSEILELVKDDFDWFELDKDRATDWEVRGNKTIHLWECQREGEFGEERSLVAEHDKSLADLFTNRSFLEAVVKAQCQIRKEKCIHGRGCEGKLKVGWSCGEILQNKLIRNLTYNNGENVLQILNEFIGKG